MLVKAVSNGRSPDLRNVWVQTDPVSRDFEPFASNLVRLGIECTVDAPIQFLGIKLICQIPRNLHNADVPILGEHRNGHAQFDKTGWVDRVQGIGTKCNWSVSATLASRASLSS